MKNAERRNITAPSRRPNFKAKGYVPAPSLNAVKHKAANVPGDEAFLIGLMNFSNSSDNPTHLPDCDYSAMNQSQLKEIRF